MTKTITKEKVFHHTIDQIWNAITKAEEISTWFLEADFKAEVGYKYTFNSSGENCSPIIGEVLEASPYTLVYTWIVKDTPATTTVRWKLEDLGDSTKLYLEHSGIENYAGETAIEMFNSFNGGWDNCINGLTNYLNELVDAK